MFIYLNGYVFVCVCVSAIYALTTYMPLKPFLRKIMLIYIANFYLFSENISIFKLTYRNAYIFQIKRLNFYVINIMSQRITYTELIMHAYKKTYKKKNS